MRPILLQAFFFFLVFFLFIYFCKVYFYEVDKIDRIDSVNVTLREGVSKETVKFIWWFLCVVIFT